MTTTIPAINAVANQRQPGFVAEVLRVAKRDGDNLKLTASDWTRIRSEYATGLRGLGDVVAAATKAIGIQPCGGCKKRQDWLNRAVPFGATPQPAPPAPEPELSANRSSREDSTS